MRFIHTADWHIGRALRFVHDLDRRSVLKEARLEAIGRIAAASRQHGVREVLLAGDLFDAVEVGEVVLRQPLERMRDASPTRWHLIPGNHDPDRPGGPWDRIARLMDLPANVLVHREPGPFELAAGVWLLPAPLRARAHSTDPTAWMDDAATPEGALRIGLAHGPVIDFGRIEHRDRSAVANLIAPDRAERAGLSYLALGDWHTPLQVGPRTWYAGTPEADGFSGPERGAVLLVEPGAGGDPPRVEPLPVGQYVWRTERAVVEDEASIDGLVTRLRSLSPEDGFGRLCLRLQVAGTLSLAGRARFEDRVVAWLQSALGHLRLEIEDLLDAPGTDDLDLIATGGAVRLAAERLSSLAADQDDPRAGRARAALRLLYRERRRAEPA